MKFKSIKDTNNTIYIKLLNEEIPSKLVSICKKVMEGYFPGCQVKVDPILLPISSLSVINRVNTNTGYNQYHVLNFLNKAKSRIPSDAYAMLCLTTEDLYPGDSWNYVFGYAFSNPRIGAFSIARYYAKFYNEEPEEDEEDWVIYKTCRVMVHEATHMFGLTHCIYYSCGMNGFNCIEEAMKRIMDLCPICLRKLQSVLKFDNIKRYEGLKSILSELPNTFNEDLKWYIKRILYLKK